MEESNTEKQVASASTSTTADNNVNIPVPLWMTPTSEVFSKIVGLDHEVNPCNLQFFWLDEEKLAGCDIAKIADTMYLEEMEWNIYYEEKIEEAAKRFWEGVDVLFSKIGRYVKVLTLRLVDSTYLPACIEDIKTYLICEGIFRACPTLTALKICGTWEVGAHNVPLDAKNLNLMHLDVISIHRKAEGLSVMKALCNIADAVRHLSLFENQFTRYFRDCKEMTMVQILTLGCLGAETWNPKDVVYLFQKVPNVKKLALMTVCVPYIPDYADFVNGILELTKVEELTTDDSLIGLNAEDDQKKVAGLQSAVLNWSGFNLYKKSMLELYINVPFIRIVTSSSTMHANDMRQAVATFFPASTNITVE